MNVPSAATSTALHAAAKPRIGSIDLIRGGVMILMAIDHVRVVRRDAPEVLYALHGDETLAQSPEFQAFATAHDEMGRAYRAQAWDEAELLWDRIREEVQAQADVIRAQAEVQRAEIDQARIRMRSQFRLARTVDRRVVVVCPKTGVRIAVNAGMRLAEVSPDVEDSF